MTKAGLPIAPSFLEGLFLVLNAIPEACLIIDSPSCGDDKIGKIGIHHDFSSNLLSFDQNNRVYYSQLEAEDFVFYSEEKWINTALKVAEKQKPKLLFITQSSAINLFSADIENTAEELEQKLQIPVVVVPSRVLSGDYLDGIALGMEALAKKLPMGECTPVKDSVALLGYMMDRGEGDQQANLRELRRMISALRLQNGPIWLSGETPQTLGALAAAEYIFAFPYSPGITTAIEKRLGKAPDPIHIPIGLNGSSEWIRLIGEKTDKTRNAEEFIEAELERTVPRIEWAVRRLFNNCNAAVVMDPYLAPEFVDFLSELGMNVRLAAIQARNQAPAQICRARIEKTGRQIPIVEDPFRAELTEIFEELSEQNRLDIIIGSASARDCAKNLSVPFLEIAYPSYLRHALYEAPWLGFEGALWLAESMFNLLSDWNYRKH